MKRPAEELVDIVSEAGQTIGVVTRREMRHQRLPHRCVYLLVFSSRGELLIHQRTPDKDVYPSYWDLTVGGVLAAGESFGLGVRREAREEIGVDVEPVLLFPFRFEDTLTSVHAEVFRAVHDGPFQFQPEEIVGGEFARGAALAERIARHRCCPDGLQVWAEYERRFPAR